MAFAFCFVKQVHTNATRANRRIAFDANLHGDTVGSLEADAAHPNNQGIWVGMNSVDGLGRKHLIQLIRLTGIQAKAA